MLVISTEQMDHLQELSRRQFEQDMCEHMQSFAPEHCAAVGAAAVTLAVQQGLRRALGYGLARRGPLTLYLELQWMFGARFDDDPQLPWVAEILTQRPALDEMDRAQCLYEQALQYLASVCGPDHRLTWRAFAACLALLDEPVAADAAEPAALLALFARLYPSKYDWVGPAALTRLIAGGLERAHGYGLGTARERALFCLLLFFAGHGCDEDPLRPWIGQTLHDPHIVHAGTRGRRLEQKTVRVLRELLARRPPEMPHV